MPIDEAVTAPRLHNQWQPDEVMVEPGFPPDVLDALKARGHKIVPVAPGTSANSIEVTPRRLCRRRRHAHPRRAGGGILRPNERFRRARARGAARGRSRRHHRRCFRKARARRRTPPTRSAARWRRSPSRSCCAPASRWCWCIASGANRVDTAEDFEARLGAAGEVRRWPLGARCHRLRHWRRRAGRPRAARRASSSTPT